MRIEPLQKRSAGILLHITSLPSPYGVGDFGQEAREFARTLHESGQQWWQILPLNPTDVSTYPSPYSSISSMAGNTLLLSPDLLAEEGLLEAYELVSYQQPSGDRADFNGAYRIKNELFNKAYDRFCKQASQKSLAEYHDFCQLESNWLNDFALYVLLKSRHNGSSWINWEIPYKTRDTAALTVFSQENERALDQIKWLQFVFAKQWRSLKDFCNKLDVKFFGDLPFYVSHDSADVWSNRELFSLDEEGHVTGMAGCPPDYFSETGQLWGMPVFKWDILKNQRYSWWIKRLQKNMELYNLLRLDHFRAFANYWDVPGGETTAINGSWKPGPGYDFFNVVEEKMGCLPFVAEDLGEIDKEVYELRDTLKFPGMKILQFAFGGNDDSTFHVPHLYTPNFVVYTGNHDNNTTIGWFRQDAGEEDRQRINAYTGMQVTEHNVHLILSRLAYASVAQMVILPMQDVLGQNESERFNTPGTMEYNWTWKLLPGAFNETLQRQLKEWVVLYDRA